ncbi:MAG: aspartyl/glutamyl-tRNA amidotransferase subunit A [Anaerolineaceae bacterium 4572_5.2]|nr:MAG: aspartyl/glutamyl-tRNA amidotransferase subunit A [Anaerolineaceae bacterium 4572_5.2]
MTDNILHQLTIQEAQRKFRSGEITAVELTRSALDRILGVDNQVKAYITLQPEAALEAARAADAARAQGKDAPLLGIPIAVKDSIITKGLTTTCGSKILENFIPPYDAAVTEKLRQAGAIILGKTNTDEFTMGSSTEHSAFFPTSNPWNLDAVPGGSSGGSAAAVAASETLAALGTDTGGSVRQPASLCGVVGLKPTYGRVSRYGIIAHGSSLDQVGPLTKSVADAAIMLGVIAGADPRDSTTLNAPVPNYLQELAEASFKGLKIGAPREYFIEGMNPAVEKAVRAALKTAEDQGAELVDISLPHTQYGIPVYYLISTAEASSNLSRYDGVRYGLRIPAETMWQTFFETRAAGFGPEVKRRIMLGTYALSAGYYDAYYLKAQKVRTLLKRDFEAAFQQVDVIFTPSVPDVAFNKGQKMDDPLQMYLSDIFTVTANLAGICGISVPCGFSDGLPIGLQILGPALGESAILKAAYAYEQATEWGKQRPEI